MLLLMLHNLITPVASISVTLLLAEEPRATSLEGMSLGIGLAGNGLVAMAIRTRVVDSCSCWLWSTGACAIGCRRRWCAWTGRSEALMGTTRVIVVAKVVRFHVVLQTFCIGELAVTNRVKADNAEWVQLSPYSLVFLSRIKKRTHPPSAPPCPSNAVGSELGTGCPLVPCDASGMVLHWFSILILERGCKSIKSSI